MCNAMRVAIHGCLCDHDWMPAEFCSGLYRHVWNRQVQTARLHITRPDILPVVYFALITLQNE